MYEMVMDCMYGMVKGFEGEKHMDLKIVFELVVWNGMNCMYEMVKKV